MFINKYTSDIFTKAALGLNYDLNTASEPGKTLGNSVLGLGGKHSLYLCDQLHPGLAGSSIWVPLKCAPHLKVHQVEVK